MTVLRYLDKNEDFDKMLLRLGAFYTRNRLSDPYKYGTPDWLINDIKKNHALGVNKCLVLEWDKCSFPFLDILDLPEGKILMLPLETTFSDSDSVNRSLEGALNECDIYIEKLRKECHIKINDYEEFKKHRFHRYHKKTTKDFIVAVHWDKEIFESNDKILFNYWKEYWHGKTENSPISTREDDWEGLFFYNYWNPDNFFCTVVMDADEVIAQAVFQICENEVRWIQSKRNTDPKYDAYKIGNSLIFRALEHMKNLKMDDLNLGIWMPYKPIWTPSSKDTANKFEYSYHYNPVITERTKYNDTRIE